jgi:hypothetical protein
MHAILIDSNDYSLKQGQNRSWMIKNDTRNHFSLIDMYRYKSIVSGYIAWLDCIVGFFLKCQPPFFE